MNITLVLPIVAFAKKKKKKKIHSFSIQIYLLVSVINFWLHLFLMYIDELVLFLLRHTLITLISFLFSKAFCSFVRIIRH